jgi:hypothetical protein
MNGISPDSTGALNFLVVTGKLQVPDITEPGRMAEQEAELPTRPPGSTLTPDGHGDRSGGVFAAGER